MFSGTPSKESYIGEVLRQLNSGKTIKNLLMEYDWKQRAKLLLNLKEINRCHEAFSQAMKN